MNKGEENKIKSAYVKKACVNCQRIHKKCDNKRPCYNCIRRKIDCCDVENKYRKGMKPPSPRSKNNPKLNLETIKIESENIDNITANNKKPSCNLDINSTCNDSNCDLIHSTEENTTTIFNSTLDILISDDGRTMEDDSGKKRKLMELGASIDFGNTEVMERGKKIGIDSDKDTTFHIEMNPEINYDIRYQELISQLDNQNKNIVPDLPSLFLSKGIHFSQKHFIQSKEEENLPLISEYSLLKIEESTFMTNKTKEEISLEMNKMKQENILLKKQIEQLKKQKRKHKEEDKVDHFKNFAKFFREETIPLDYLSHFTLKKDSPCCLLQCEKNLSDTEYNPSNFKFLEVSESCAFAHGCFTSEMIDKPANMFSPNFSKNELEEFSLNLLKCCKQKYNHVELTTYIKHQIGLIVSVDISCSILCDENLKPQFLFYYFNKSNVVEDQVIENFKTLFKCF